jgi:predicted acyl esterase
MRTRRVHVVVVLSLVLSSLVAVAPSAPPAAAAGGGIVDLTGSVAATFTVTAGVEQMTVRGATPRAPLTIARADTLERIITLYTDSLGQLVVQYVPANYLVFDSVTQGVLPTADGGTLPPGNYRVVSEGVPGQPFAGPVKASGVVHVPTRDEHPNPSIYNQVLPKVFTSVLGGVQPGSTDATGYGYLTTRDGTKLSVNVRLPDPGLYGDGPYPTVVQYSGYAPSKPGTPDGPDAGGLLASIFGFAYVGVNVRGSGCSGGVFDAFNPIQAADGYDVIETVARQPWVKNGKVGMMGISFSGITQLYTAAARPPSLAAIAPLSVIEDPWYQQWPGGIYNAGFTQAWLAQRDDESAGGAPWVKNRVKGGDTTCSNNLKIRSQSIPFEAFGKSLVNKPATAEARNLSMQVHDIEVPVFLTGAWQDEQTGARFGLMLDNFTSVPAGDKKFTMFNGQHSDGLSPLILTRWFEFLSLYVDRSVPQINPLIRAFAPAQLEANFGVPGLGFEPDRFIAADETTPVYGDYDGTLAAYRSEQPVRVLFEVGASPDFPASPRAHRQRFEMSFPSWPPPDAAAQTFFFGADGTLSDGTAVPAGVSPPASAGQVPRGVDRFSFDPAGLGTRFFVSGNQGAVNYVNNWKATADGKGLAYETPPLTRDVVVAGEGYVDLWLRTSGTDTPLEVVLSEVYAQPDANGKSEVRVQHGLLRPGYRTLDPTRTNGTQIDELFGAADYQPMPAGEFVNVKVPLYSLAHPFRAGSRLRLEVNTAGGDASLWDFESPSYGTTTNDVARGGQRASALVLPVLPDTADRSIPAQFGSQAARPPCDSLRGAPCRIYKHLANQTLAIAPTAYDFDGFGTADRGVYRNGGWIVAGQATRYFGLAGDVPVPADYDGDGVTDRAVYRKGAWLVQGQAPVYFGLAGDVPVPADFDGDGSADRAVYRKGAWLVQGQAPVYFGLAGDVPVPADFDGDGSADRAVYRKGAWLVQGQAPVYFGLAGDVPVPADYNGDGSADRMVYRNGGWLSPAFAPVYFGLAGDLPVPADYNGDGSADRMVYRNGGWLSPSFAPVYLGLATDRPLSTPIGQ